jgi:cytochrome c peroxidase
LSHVATVRLGCGSATGTIAQRGEALFRDARLAFDRWMSCSTCHTEGHTSGLAYDTLGDGDYGAAKLTPSLLGVGDTPPYAWTGSFPRLEDQANQSLRTSLHGPAPRPEEVAALVAYLRTLAPPPPRRSADDPAALRGAALFAERRCQGCHRPPALTAGESYDVGTAQTGEPTRRFNPPALRGVSWRRPYVHDGRFDSLVELVEAHHPGVRDGLSPREVEDLVAYLESL